MEGAVGGGEMGGAEGGGREGAPRALPRHWGRKGVAPGGLRGRRSTQRGTRQAPQARNHPEGTGGRRGARGVGKSIEGVQGGSGGVEAGTGTDGHLGGGRGALGGLLGKSSTKLATSQAPQARNHQEDTGGSWENRGEVGVEFGAPLGVPERGEERRGGSGGGYRRGRGQALGRVGVTGGTTQDRQPWSPDDKPPVRHWGRCGEQWGR